jgi:CysZ protein
MGLAVIASASLVGLVLAQPLSACAMEKISLAQERAMTGRCRAELGFLRSLFLGVRVAVVTLLIGGAVLGSLFVIDLIFPPAVVVTFPVKFLFVGWLLAWDFVDYPLGLRGYGVRARLGWASRHFGAFTAFGLSWAAVLVVPCAAPLLLPMGVAGATRLVVAAERAEEHAWR